MPRTLRIEALSKRFPDGTVALRDVSLVLEPGEIVAILGRSGAGKSTLLRCASRLLEPTSGRVFLGDLELTRCRGAALARAMGQVGFVFQQFNLVGNYTVLDNVLAGRLGKVGFWRGLLGLFTEQDQTMARRCLADVGMEHKLHALARELSGGQQQRVAIARAFAQEPSALFADEPTASLDPKLSERVLGLLRGYGKDKNVPVLLNVHTVEHARRFADRCLGMRRGALVFDGPSTALTDAVLSEIYRDDDDEDDDEEKHQHDEAQGAKDLDVLPAATSRTREARS